MKYCLNVFEYFYCLYRKHIGCSIVKDHFNFILGINIQLYKYSKFKFKFNETK